LLPRATRGPVVIWPSPGTLAQSQSVVRSCVCVRKLKVRRSGRRGKVAVFASGVFTRSCVLCVCVCVFVSVCARGLCNIQSLGCTSSIYICIYIYICIHCIGSTRVARFRSQSCPLKAALLLLGDYNNADLLQILSPRDLHP